MHGVGAGAPKGNKETVNHGAMVAESIAVRRSTDFSPRNLTLGMLVVSPEPESW